MATAILDDCYVDLLGGQFAEQRGCQIAELLDRYAERRDVPAVSEIEDPLRAGVGHQPGIAASVTHQSGPCTGK